MKDKSSTKKCALSHLDLWVHVQSEDNFQESYQEQIRIINEIIEREFNKASLKELGILGAILQKEGTDEEDLKTHFHSNDNH